jgi:tRNA threonylcarbamoyladenosine biosynthesis protein TsaB
MRVLALDTASPYPALALAELSGGAVVRELLRPLPPAAAEAIAPELQRLLAEAGLDAKAVSRVAVLSGPGSFTGVRAGLAFARGIARALGVPLVPVRTFRAAASAYEERPDADLLLDAGRGEVFRARRRRGVVTEDAVPVPAARAAEDAATDGVAVIDLSLPGASLAAAAASLGAAVAPGDIDGLPVYGRPSAAEEKLEGRRP